MRSTVTKTQELERDRAVALRTADRVIETIRGRRVGTAKGKTSAVRNARLALPTAREIEVSAVTRSVEDPNNSAQTIDVAFNRRVDLLAEEYANHRISEAAFRVGRDIQSAFEAGSRIGVASSPDMAAIGGSAASSDTLMHTRHVERARRANAEMKRLEREVGSTGARFLRQILADGVGFQDYALARGRSDSERQVALVADRFRSMLDEIADERAARGRAS